MADNISFVQWSEVKYDKHSLVADKWHFMLMFLYLLFIATNVFVAI